MTLYKVGRERDACVLVKDGRAGVADKVGGHDRILCGAENALHGALRGLLHGGANVIVCGALLQVHGEVDHGDVNRWDSRCHACEKAVHVRHDLSDGLGCAGGGRDEVLVGCASTAPILRGRAVDGGLRGRHSMNRVHEATGNAPVIMEDLGHRSEAIGRARRIALMSGRRRTGG